jgi:hypothetical protein
MGSSSTLYNSESIFMSHTDSLLAALVEMYYAFAVLWAMEPCFLLDQEIIVEPKLKQYLEVLFWSNVLPIQYEFVYP